MRNEGSPIKLMCVWPMLDCHPSWSGAYTLVLFMETMVLYPMLSPMPIWWKYHVGIPDQQLVKASPRAINARR